MLHPGVGKAWFVIEPTVGGRITRTPACWWARSGLLDVVVGGG